MKQKNFKEIYDRIYQNIGTQIEEERKKVLNKKKRYVIISVLDVAIIFFGFFAGVNNDNAEFMSTLLTYLVSIGVPIYFVVTVIVWKMYSSKYVELYKQKVIKEVVKQSNPGLVYEPGMGISSGLYRDSDFDTSWDRYTTEDRISGNLENGARLEMAQVQTENRETTTDSDGHTTTTYTTTFFGLFGVIYLETMTPADFAIMANSGFSKFNKNRIDMESAEFEKYYDVYANYSRDWLGRRKKSDGDSRQSTMEILTPESIENLVKIRNLFKRPINIRFYKNKIYFRIEVGDIFEPPALKNATDINLLQKYFYIIDVPRMIYETLIDNILVMYGNEAQKEKRNLSQMNDEEKQEDLENKDNTEINNEANI